MSATYTITQNTMNSSLYPRLNERRTGNSGAIMPTPPPPVRPNRFTQAHTLRGTRDYDGAGTYVTQNLTTFATASTSATTSTSATASTSSSTSTSTDSPIVPIDNINICILGTVSAGKSTILNSMFCQDFSQSKIKRTTMMPTAFVETGDASSCMTPQAISEEISRTNAEIISSTERGQVLNLESYGNQLVFNVDKLDIAISEKFNVTIFDMPGLNDARTKEQYFEYLRKNFSLFNIIIFVVNIESGLNTSDEMEILELCASNIEIQAKSNKNIRMLTIANKADEMQLNPITGYPEIVSDELKEM